MNTRSRCLIVVAVLAACLMAGCQRESRSTAHLQRAAHDLADRKFIAGRHQVDLAISADPASVSTYLVAMDLYKKAGRRVEEAEVGELLLEQAKRAKTKPRLSDDQLAAVYSSMAEAYWQANQLSQAETAYLEAVKLTPNNGMLLNNFGYFYAEHDIKITDALALTRKAVKLVPNDGVVLDSLGWALYQAGHYRQAAETLHSAVVLKSDDPQMRYHLGAAYARLGKPDSARIELTKALVLDGTLVEAKQLLAKFHK